MIRHHNILKYRKCNTIVLLNICLNMHYLKIIMYFIFPTGFLQVLLLFLLLELTTSRDIAAGKYKYLAHSTHK